MTPAKAINIAQPQDNPYVSGLRSSSSVSAKETCSNEWRHLWCIPQKGRWGGHRVGSRRFALREVPHQPSKRVIGAVLAKSGFGYPVANPNAVLAPRDKPLLHAILFNALYLTLEINKTFQKDGQMPAGILCRDCFFRASASCRTVRSFTAPSYDPNLSWPCLQKLNQNYLIKGENTLCKWNLLFWSAELLYIL